MRLEPRCVITWIFACIGAGIFIAAVAWQVPSHCILIGVLGAIALPFLAQMIARIHRSINIGKKQGG
nr:hypothetical protein [Candidatus Sigynarchaeota archaeon]